MGPAWIPCLNLLSILDMLPPIMLYFLRAVFTLLCLVVNTTLWCSLLYVFALIKVLVPIQSVQNVCSKIVIAFAENWISCNNFALDHFYKINWKISGLENLRHDRSYLISSNHRSWTDIVVLQKVLNRRVPFLRFFIKQQLIYVPLLGIAWVALDFPRMKRYSAAYLAKHPEKRGEDLKTTRRMCDRLKGKPVSILNFLEGTRYTPEKAQKQNSSYKHLLKPKRGGLMFTLEAMGEQFHSLLDVTLYYPQPVTGVWGLLLGKMPEVVVEIKEVEIPRIAPGESYLESSAQRGRFQAWVEDMWTQKDQTLSEMDLFKRNQSISP